jgi:HAD superfamily hydrolase (TIGR01450 family)
MASSPPPRRPLLELAPAYDAVLLDAYGVLKDAQGALPGAAAALAGLDAARVPWCVVTNDASRLPATLEATFAGIGLSVPADRIVTSGDVLDGWYAAHGLAGARTLVIGTADSRRHVERAGGVVVPIADDAEAEVVCVADDAGFDVLPTMNAALSAIVRAAEAGRPPRLVLPNPDLIYPRAAGFGFTAGAFAAMLELGLERRLGPGLRFEPLGKPAPAIFHLAAARLGARRPLMVGDQLETDVAGALAAGYDVAMVETGIARWPGRDPALRPTWLTSLV